MGLFDKWKPRKGIDNESVKREMTQMGENAVTAVNTQLESNTEHGLQKQGFDLSLADQGTLNPNESERGVYQKGNKILVNENYMTKDVGNRVKDINMPPAPKVNPGPDAIKLQPKTTDITGLEGADLLDGLAPMSEEERMRNAQRANAVSGIAHFGNALAALGNVFAVGAGAPSQVNPQLQNPDVEGYLERGRQQRMQYEQMKRNMELQDKDNVRKDAVLKMQMEEAKRKADLEEKLAPYKENKAMFEAMAAQYGVTKAEAEALYKQLEAKNAPTKFQLENDVKRAQKGSYQASQAANYATANLRNAEANRKTDESFEYFYSDNEGEIKVDKKKIGNRANLAKIHQLTGESTTKESPNGYGKVSKDTNDLLTDIGKHINDAKIAKALKDLQSGKANNTEEIDY